MKIKSLKSIFSWKNIFDKKQYKTFYGKMGLRLYFRVTIDTQKTISLQK